MNELVNLVGTDEYLFPRGFGIGHSDQGGPKLVDLALAVVLCSALFSCL